MCNIYNTFKPETFRPRTVLYRPEGVRFHCICLISKTKWSFYVKVCMYGPHVDSYTRTLNTTCIHCCIQYFIV